MSAPKMRVVRLGQYRWEVYLDDVKVPGLRRVTWEVDIDKPPTVTLELLVSEVRMDGSLIAYFCSPPEPTA